MNLWPLAYWREPVGSVAWPLVSWGDDHFALRPVYSRYGKERNFLWPIGQHDSATGDGRAFPVFWGKDRFNIFPLVWNDNNFHSLFPFFFWRENDYMTLFPLAWWDIDGESFTLFPLYGHSKDADWLFPLYRWQSDNSGKILFGLAGWEKDGSNWVFPLYGYDADDGDFTTALFGRATHSGHTDWWWLTPLAGYTTGDKSDTASTITTDGVPTWQQSEARAQTIYGGSDQVSYLNGQELVGRGTAGATRPDVVRTVGGHLEGIEVKNYDLVNNSYQLVNEITREVSNRVVHMPAGSTQRIVLDVAGRGYSSEIVDGVIKQIVDACAEIYPYGPIPVDVLSW